MYLYSLIAEGKEVNPGKQSFNMKKQYLLKIVHLLVLVITCIPMSNAQTFDCGTSMLTDVDGYQYHTVLMGSRCWTQENMRTTHYANGQPVGIPVTSNEIRERMNFPGKLQVNLNLPASETIMIEIYNLDGKEVFNRSLAVGSGSNLIDISIGPENFYIVNLCCGTTKSTFKVVGGEAGNIEVKSIPASHGVKSEVPLLDPDPRYYYVYDNDPANDEKFGKLYTPASALNVEFNWTVTLDSVIQGICPDGWHVPSDSDWIQLELFKGMTPEEINIMFDPVRGTIANTLKTSDTTYWYNDWGTGDLEFSARGAGFYRPQPDSGFFVLKDQTDWITYNPIWGPMIRNVTSFSVSVLRSVILWQDLGYAYSVRCIKNY
jgi:uncharacterized protein (TIGR02145 family)